MAEAYATPISSSTEAARAGQGFGGVQPILSVRHIEKVYGTKDSITHALAGVSFDVVPGEFIGIMGPSGSGKTTLLNCVATIDTVTSGHILIGGRDITNLRSRELARFRRDELGFIFQDSNLLDTLNGFENISIALSIKGIPANQISAKVNAIAETLGVSDVLKKYPYQMSGGQKQRIAAARAMAADPKLVLADEPTGALDSKNGREVLGMLRSIADDPRRSVVVVTHDLEAASLADRILVLKDGQVVRVMGRSTAAQILEAMGGSQ